MTYKEPLSAPPQLPLESSLDKPGRAIDTSRQVSGEGAYLVRECMIEIINVPKVYLPFWEPDRAVKPIKSCKEVLFPKQLHFMNL